MYVLKIGVYLQLSYLQHERMAYILQYDMTLNAVIRSSQSVVLHTL